MLVRRDGIRHEPFYFAFQAFQEGEDGLSVPLRKPTLANPILRCFSSVYQKMKKDLHNIASVVYVVVDLIVIVEVLAHHYRQSLSTHPNHPLQAT